MQVKCAEGLKNEQHSTDSFSLRMFQSAIILACNFERAERQQCGDAMTNGHLCQSDMRKK